MDDLVRGVAASLVEAVRANGRDVAAPVTVAEIYQDLVPYRDVRGRLGFEMNADYEHTLLRLLSGEGAFVRLEPDEAREELRAEVESPNPNVGLFRKFAGCDVWITADGASVEAVEMSTDELGWVPEVEDAIDLNLTEEEEPVENGRPPAEVVAGPAPAEPVAPMPALEGSGSSAERRPSLRARAHATSGSLSSGGSMCAFCDSGLPSGRVVLFCPFCGADQSTRPCPSCAEPLEAGWQFCISCGEHTPATAGA